MREDFIEYLKENFSIEEAKIIYSCYNKIEYILKLNEYARKKTKSIIEISCGDHNSKHLILLNTMKDDDFKDFLRTLLGKLHKNYYDFYITSVNKTKDETINLEVLEREILAINPKYVYTYESIKPIMEKLKLKEELIIKYINDNDFKQMISYMNRKKEVDVKVKNGEPVDWNAEDSKVMYNYKSLVWKELKTLTE